MTSPENSQHDTFPGWGLTEHEASLLTDWGEGSNAPRGMITPGEAGEHLAKLGYGTDKWEDIAKERMISHEVAGLAIIALGSEPRLKRVIPDNLCAIDVISGKIPLGARPNDREVIQTTLKDKTIHTGALIDAINTIQRKA